MNKRKCDVVAEAERTGLRVAQLQAEARAAVGLSRSHSAEPGQLDRCKEFTSPCTVDPLSGGGRQGKLADTCKAAPMADSNEVEAQYIANSKIPTLGGFNPAERVGNGQHPHSPCRNARCQSAKGASCVLYVATP
eukprot:CAMPEP_0117680166 /NCGR_PEP_ID=MMETSP0804-20121206/18199_1 /TAXON_ID=1074897 /ORGANISM="Tetraselmis astigmatica, Strain CCMP880" /LENGTH=134 /DNA_ID=CAMNT_0005489629 /DNA_START=289 /DNA_END=694 /DNA_ORIENTATION=+